mgnify:CR=1 FL=1
MKTNNNNNRRHVTLPSMAVVVAGTAVVGVGVVLNKLRRMQLRLVVGHGVFDKSTILLPEFESSIPEARLLEQFGSTKLATYHKRVTATNWKTSKLFFAVKNKKGAFCFSDRLRGVIALLFIKTFIKNDK